VAAVSVYLSTYSTFETRRRAARQAVCLDNGILHCDIQWTHSKLQDLSLTYFGSFFYTPLIVVSRAGLNLLAGRMFGTADLGRYRNLLLAKCPTCV